MRALVVETFGEPDDVRVLDVPEPSPGHGQVKLEVAAAAVDPVDLATLRGLLHAEGLHGDPPLRLGWDVAGVVTTIGPGVGRLRVGQFVVGLSDRLAARSKTHAERVVLDADAVAAVAEPSDPASLSMLPLAGSTAWQALELADLRRGGSLLVTGAAGNVGALVVQVAVIRGLQVIGSGRPGHRSTIEALGATYAAADHVAEAVRELVPGGVDATIDAAGIGAAALDAVRDRGRHISLVVTQRPAPLRGVRSTSLAVRSDWEHLAILASLHSSGALTLPRARRSFTLDDAPAAYTAATHERVVLTP